MRIYNSWNGNCLFFSFFVSTGHCQFHVLLHFELKCLSNNQVFQIFALILIFTILPKMHMDTNVQRSRKWFFGHARRKTAKERSKIQLQLALPQLLYETAKSERMYEKNYGNCLGPLSSCSSSTSFFFAKHKREKEKWNVYMKKPVNMPEAGYNKHLQAILRMHRYKCWYHSHVSVCVCLSITTSVRIS